MATANRKRWGKSVGRRPDLTNLVAAVENALNGLAYRDDALVAEQVTRKVYGEKDGIRVRVEELSRDAIQSRALNGEVSPPYITPAEKPAQLVVAPDQPERSVAREPLTIPEPQPRLASYYEESSVVDESVEPGGIPEENDPILYYRDHWSRVAVPADEMPQGGLVRTYRPRPWGRYPWASRRTPERPWSGYENRRMGK